MPYAPQTWVDLSQATPLDAARLTVIENGISASSVFYNVKDSAYGALGNGVADDTAAIQAAIDACFAAGGGVVWIPAGIYMISQLILKDGTSLWGSGQGSIFNNVNSGHTPGTVLRAKLGGTLDMITQASGLGLISRPELRGFTLDGNNGSNYSSPAQTVNSFDGIHFTAQVSDFRIFDVNIQNVPRDAISFDAAVTAGGAKLDRVSINSPYRHGVNHNGSDTHYNMVEVNNAGQHCFVLAGTQGMWTNCKSNGAGQLLLGLGSQDGWHISGASHILAGCSSENDWPANSNGFAIAGGARNHVHGTASGSGNALLYLSGGASNNDVYLIGNNQQNHNNPNYVYQIDGSTTKNNRVQIKGNPTTLTAYSLLSNSGSENSNQVECENESPQARQVVAYAASLTPDPYLGGFVSVGTLTGAITINNPANGHAGSRITFRLTQDGTGGRVVTWGAAYAVASTLSTVAASSTVISFIYDGVTWREVSCNPSVIPESQVSGLVSDLAAKAPSSGIAESAVTNLVSDLAAKAPIASPVLTGDPQAPTASVDDNDTSIASTAFVLGQLSAAGDGTPAINGTAARGTSTHGARADHIHPTDTTRAPTASPTLTGTVTLPSGLVLPNGVTASTQAPGDNSLKLATTAYADAISALKLNLTGGTMSGAIAMGSNAVTGLADGVALSDAATVNELTLQEYLLNGSQVIRRSLPRNSAVTGDLAATATGVMLSVAVVLFKGDVITKLCFRSGGTAGATLTHWWFALYDNQATPALLQQTADQGSAAWGANTTMDLSLAASVTITTTAVYYAAVMVAATTVPTLRGVNATIAPASAGYVTGQKVLAQTSGSALGATAPGTIATPATATAIAMVEAH